MQVFMSFEWRLLIGRSAINIGFIVLLQPETAWLEAHFPLIVTGGVHIPNIPGKFLLISIRLYCGLLENADSDLQIRLGPVVDVFQAAVIKF